MADGEDRMQTPPPRQWVRRTPPRVGAARGAASEQQVLDRLREAGRQLLEERVPADMLEVLRSGEARRD